MYLLMHVSVRNYAELMIWWIRWWIRFLLLQIGSCPGVFLEHLLSHFLFLGMWGGSGNVGEWWDCIVVHLCKCSGNCGFSFMLCGIPDLKWSWQRGLLLKWSLRQSKEFSYFYHETLSKSFLPKDIVAGLVLFSDPAWIFKGCANRLPSHWGWEHSSHNHSSVASWYCSPFGLAFVLNSQPRPAVEM